MFAKWKQNRANARAAKTNTTSYYNSALAFDPDRNATLWNDKINPPQPYCITKQYIDPLNATHRHQQMEHNNFFHKLTYGLAQKLMSKQPYPFSYAKIPEVSSNAEKTDIQTADGQRSPVQRATAGDRAQSAVKSNSVAPPNLRNVPSAAPQGSKPIFGQSPFSAQPAPLPSYSYEIRDDMSQLYPKWLADNMFEIAGDALAKGFGICCSVIVRTKSQGKTHFWVFDRSHIAKIYTRDRIPVKIEVIWPGWTDAEEIDHKIVDQANKTYEIGKDCVFFVPLPQVNSAYGKSLLYPVWTAGVAKDYLRMLQTLFAYKGGIANRYYRIPKSSEASTLTQNIETETKKPMGGDAVVIQFPPGLSPEAQDKFFQHEETNANDINWDVLNTIFSQDTPFPKSFIEGQVETGALGGSAPEMDAEKEKETVGYYFHYLDKLVKMINETFYDVTDNEYLVVPYQDNATNTTQAGTPDATTEDQTPQAEPAKPSEVDEEKTKTKRTFKFNSITADGLYEYDAVLLPIESDIPYDGHTENVTIDTIKEYVDDPLSVKEGYVQEEHPDNPAEVSRDDAIGKYKITGYDARGMIGKIYYKQKPSVDTLSNFYYSHDQRVGEKIVHARIDFKNVVTTRAPRMKGAKQTES